MAKQRAKKKTKFCEPTPDELERLDALLLEEEDDGKDIETAFEDTIDD